MTIRDSLATVSDGDQLNEGYYNGIFDQLETLGFIKLFYVGSGAAGDINYSSDTTLSSSEEYDTVTVDEGVTLTVDSVALRCRRLVNNGTIVASTQGSGGSRGSAAGAGTNAGGNGGEAGGLLVVLAGSIEGSGVFAVDGGEGDSPEQGSNPTGGTNVDINGSSGSAGSGYVWDGSSVNPTAGLGGQNGLAARFTGTTSGRSGGGSRSGVTQSNIGEIFSKVIEEVASNRGSTGGGGASGGWARGTSGTSSRASGGGGGSGGSFFGDSGNGGSTGSATTDSNANAGTNISVGGGGGGGGGSGGILFILTFTNEFTGEIRANGGDGGDGADANRQGGRTAASGGGGGGGGSGGLIVAMGFSEENTILVNGGLGGSPGESRVGAEDVASVEDSNPGNPGSEGMVFFL